MSEVDIVRESKEVQVLIAKSDEYLEKIGYTVHGIEHVQEVAKRSERIAKCIGLSYEDTQAAVISAYLHDIGNFMGRENHQLSGALLAYNILKSFNFDINLISKVMTAIASHDETNSEITDKVSAVLILADKSHVHKQRVREKDIAKFDIHDKVNYAVQESDLIAYPTKQEIWLTLTVDTNISKVLDYFEIFLNRMLLCKKAASFLGYNFHLKINDSVLY